MSDNISKAVVDMIIAEVILKHLKSEFYQNDKIKLSNQVNEMPSFEEGSFIKGDFEKEKVFCDRKIPKNEMIELGDGWETEKILKSDGVKRYIKDDENNTSAEEEKKVLIKEEFSISYDQQDQVMQTKYEITAEKSSTQEACPVTSDEQNLVMQTSYDKRAEIKPTKEACLEISDEQDLVNQNSYDKKVEKKTD